MPIGFKAAAAIGAMGTGLVSAAVGFNRHPDADISERAHEAVSLGLLGAAAGGIAGAAGASFGKQAVTGAFKNRSAVLSGVRKGASVTAGAARSTYGAWKNTSKSAKYVATATGLTAAGIGAVTAFRKTDPEAQAYTESGALGYDVSDTPPAARGVRGRLDMIGATGDLVFGLHNQR